MASLNQIATFMCLKRLTFLSVGLPILILCMLSCTNEKHTVQTEEIEQETEGALTLKKNLKSARLHSIVEKEEKEYAEFLESDKDSFYLPGVWHSSEYVGSGYSDVYVFYDDNTFVYYASQMACDKRLVSFSGRWKSNGGNLNLSVLEKIQLIGGKLVHEDGGSCGSDSVLVDAEAKKIKVSPAEKMTIKLSKVYYEPEEDLGRKTMLFNAIRFWRISVNPNEFEFY
jgi:hypothetical protein